jgi:hypothetical protein
LGARRGLGLPPWFSWRFYRTLQGRNCHLAGYDGSDALASEAMSWAWIWMLRLALDENGLQLDSGKLLASSWVLIDNKEGKMSTPSRCRPSDWGWRRRSPQWVLPAVIWRRGKWAGPVGLCRWAG